MASWGTMKNQHMPNSKGFDENDLLTRVMLSQKHDLIQNCDLPPPMKEDIDDDDDDDGKLGLLKAISLSQTRAREAEAKCAAISKERDLLALGFMENSMQVFAYRQLVRLLQFQVSKLQQQQKKQEMCCDCGMVREDTEAMDDGNGTAGFTWIMAVAFCLGIAGFGFALGCKYKCF
ncbi:hypothetical protein Cgig2_007338 [Carnegiea gigantea]|uniref:Uncharacterized protein n=1 Tax=Carnegiea gigantea TaxID=171969 RepID=A0A9Q1KZD2_9CARY|nr:hypothetical protein Cgig2_007338 [Carnegiea gigantea]